MEHPALGNALEETRSRFYPHNVVIESFMATGIVGGIAFCAFLLGALGGATSVARMAENRWVALLFVQQLISALLAGALYLSGTMWCLAAALVAIAARQHRAAVRSPAPSRIAESPLGLGPA